MKDLLLLCHRMPWPLNKGEKIRSGHMLLHLAQRYRVHLGCPVDDPDDFAHLEVLRGMCATVGAFPISRGRQKIRALLYARPGRPMMPDFYFSPALKAWVDEVARRVRPSVVFVSSVAMWPYVAGLRDCGLILDAIDIDSEKWAEYALTSAFPMKLVWAREGRTLLAYERAAAMASDRTFFVSEPETERFAVLAPETRGKILSVENGVDLERFSPTHPYDWPFGESGPCAVFTGTMDYWPNADAVTWFAREILPGLREKVAGLRFWIVGANPTDAVLALGKLPGVTVTGRVSDVRAFVAHAAVIVCPLRIARGIQNKVLEGMAMGKAVVATRQAFEGVRAEAGRDLLVADGASAFGSSVLEVLGGMHPGLGAAARTAMMDGYAWDNVLAAMDPHVDAAAV